MDVDVRDGKRGANVLALWEAINDPLPPTYEVRSWSGGRHLKFRHETSAFQNISQTTSTSSSSAGTW